MTKARAPRVSAAWRRLVLLVLTIGVLGFGYAIWNATQPRVRLLIVNRSATAAQLTFGDARTAAVLPCTSDRYSDDPTAR